MISHNVYKGHSMKGMNGQLILALLLLPLLLLAAIFIDLYFSKTQENHWGSKNFKF